MSSPLSLTVIEVPTGALLGLCHCPGRCGGRYGKRDLAADLAEIEAFGADVLITLVEAAEFARLGVPHLADEVTNCSFRWHHVPIPDFGTPSAETWSAWARAREDVRRSIDGGGRLVLHCAAGLGRTGTIAAKLLSERGLTPAEAIGEVRRLRPGTIETAAQVAFVMTGPQLL